LVKYQTWWDYVKDAVCGDGTGAHLLGIAITSQAEGAMPSEGWATGQGKSTLAMQIMKKILTELVGYDEYIAEDYIKKNMLFNWKDYYDMMNRGMYEQRIFCATADDFHEWAGKHMSFSKPIQWIAREHTKKRPYLGVFIATMEHLGSLAAAWRDGKFMFEMKVYEKGKYEVQYIKTKTKFNDPENPYKLLDKNTIKPLMGEFPRLSGELDIWYKEMRDIANKESFREGWELHFGKDAEPNELPEEATSMDAFCRLARSCGVKATESNLRELYNRVVKPTAALVVAA